MKRVLTPAFYRFFLGFVGIISVGLLVLSITGLLSNSATPVQEVTTTMQK